MQTIQPNYHSDSNYRFNTPRRLVAMLGASIFLAGFGLAGCAQTHSQRPDTNAKPGTNAPHEERNPSQHPEQFR
ncbi:MAG: hypothetical protein INR62_08900 [Rhodospirillales bacterium]|nr:hypothetical protein [Acetobacter sp.]